MKFRTGAAISGSVWVVFWVILNYFILPRYEFGQGWQYLTAIPALATMIFVIYTAEKDRGIVAEFLFQKMKTIDKNEIDLIEPKNKLSESKDKSPDIKTEELLPRSVVSKN